MKDKSLVQSGVEMILEGLFGPEVFNHPDFKDTPKRVTKFYSEMILDSEDIKAKVAEICSTMFPSSYSGMIVLPNIRTVGFCPHHMLPVTYTIHIGYIPNKSFGGDPTVSFVLGASKPERISRLLSSDAILQETLTQNIADTIAASIAPDGLGVVVKGQHSCMNIRGIKNPCSSMVTSEMFGSFLDIQTVREEFFKMIEIGKED